ncbi:hypothetical protein FRB97_001878 [Tulasnella sp. 331]|nr:hypothetical protein FRB97_001878 [Tulasnella sp. 331]
MVESYPALAVSEVLLEILEKLSSKDLLNVAQTRKDWTEAALETRWKTGRIKLSRLLSTFTPIIEGAVFLRFDAEHVAPDRWTRFENYASKVTWLDIDVAVDPDSLDVIKTLRRISNQPLFPRVLRVDAPTFPTDLHSACGDLFTPLLDLTMVSKLEDVNLPRDVGSEMMSSVLSMLQGRALHIRHLTVPSDTFDYLGFTSLESLTHKGYLSPGHFASLALLPNLRTMHLSYEYLDWGVGEENPDRAIIFPALYDFSLSEFPIELEGAVMRSAMPVLHKLHFSSSSMRDDGTRAVDHFLHTSPLLEDLRVKVRAMPKELKLTRHERVRRLELDHFAFGVHNGYDHDWDWIGNSFPELRDLTIRHDNHITLRSTWRALPSHLIKCQGLQRLEMNLHIPTFSPQQTTLWDTPAPSLEVLKFGRMHLQKADIDPFARYLGKLCPNVKELEIRDLYELLVLKVTSNGRMREQQIDRRLEEVEKDGFVCKFFEYQAVASTPKDVVQGCAEGGRPV